MANWPHGSGRRAVPGVPLPRRPDTGKRADNGRYCVLYKSSISQDNPEAITVPNPMTESKGATPPKSAPLPIGTLQTWHLVRIPKPGSFDDRVDIWLAPQHEWYPVKVRYTDLRPEGDYIDLALSALSPGP